MNKFELYNEVQLAKDLPELGFIKGDVATIIEIINNGKGKTGYCLEFFDNNGNTLDIAVVDINSIQQPLEHGVVHYRNYSHS
jgi:hypothetical protein